MIGECDLELPKNIVKLGYIDDREIMAEIIGTSDAFLSLFFRCYESKVTCQAIQSKIPILYSNTGILPELIGDNGICVSDYTEIDFLNKTPSLDVEELKNRYYQFKYYYDDLIKNYKEIESYQETLSKYFDVFKLYV